MSECRNMGCHLERHPERLISMDGLRMEVLVSLSRAMACHLPLEDLAVVTACLRLLAVLVAAMECHSSRCLWRVAKAHIHLRLVSFRLRISRLKGVRLNLSHLHRHLQCNLLLHTMVLKVEQWRLLF